MQLASYAMRKRFATIKGGVSGDFDPNPNDWRANKQSTHAKRAKQSKACKAKQEKESKACKAKQEKESGRDDNLTHRVPVSSSGLP
jgi:hypothetical protein